MSTHVDRLKPADVTDPILWAAYVQQTCGTPQPRGKQIGYLRAMVNEFFENYPDLNYFTLCRIAQWARATKKRPATTVSLLSPKVIGWAFSDGMLPELDPALREDKQLEAAIHEALAVEQDPEWRRSLIGTEGRDARREVLELWRTQRSED